ncbi:hypothetical protein [Phenylobacterium zucineum]|uniref:hypothetical protein n=1 Tax=Phenylobacterium zucineum TaxID=284016 RepID=UPI000304A14D|nr:hypothetical protein [Phenylobacterium zucineum]
MHAQPDRVHEPASPAYEPPPPAILALGEQDALDLHREINVRRAQLENPELLRRLRSL